MSLKEQIQQSVKDSLKSGERGAVSALRVVLGEIQEIESREGKEASEERVHKIIQKQIEGNNDLKKHTSSPDITESVDNANKLLEAFLPKYMSSDEIVDYVKQDRDLHNQIIESDGEGPATGVLMKAAKQKGLNIQGKEAKEAIYKIKDQ